MDVVLNRVKIMDWTKTINSGGQNKNGHVYHTSRLAVRRDDCQSVTYQVISSQKNIIKYTFNPLTLVFGEKQINHWSKHVKCWPHFIEVTIQNGLVWAIMWFGIWYNKTRGLQLESQSLNLSQLVSVHNFQSIRSVKIS